jgi:signal transduction histidine kinase
MRSDILAIWAASVLAGLAFTYVVARRILKPVDELDRAAGEIAKGNYDCRVKAAGGDELGRLGQTFNSMCRSIQEARQELIRQERIATIGRLTTGLVHDLRNPLAAIYGGAEMLVDGQLSPDQVKRLAGYMYQSSRRIQEMLQDLLNISRGVDAEKEHCRLAEVVSAGLDAHRPRIESQKVRLEVDVPDSVAFPMARSRMERVFENLVGNAVEAMPDGGRLRIAARLSGDEVVVAVEDTGPGVPAAIVDRLFQPFVTSGKKNGLGLGLALSRQTVLDHGGDVWLDRAAGQGARFRLRLPLPR